MTDVADLADPATEAPDFDRDRWGHPMIVPPDGGDPVPYLRSSSNETEDRYNLEMWARRNVVYGMAHDNSLVARVLAIGGTPSSWDLATKRQVNKIHEDAAALALSNRRAAIGTAVHRLTERVDRGERVIAGPYEPDIEAYVNTLVEAGYTVDPRYIECRMVCDDLARAGTPDRILTRVSDRMRLIADIKTGETVEYGGLGWAAQLATYAHGQLYDPQRGVRLETPSIDRTRGLIIHLPAGEGVCVLYEIDLVAGYRAVVLDNEVRAIRKESKRWISRVTPVRPPGEAAGVGHPQPAPADIDAHPSAGKRQRLRVRYAMLGPDEQARFRAMLIDPADLNAVETALDALEEEESGAAGLPAPAAPTLVGVVAGTPSPVAAPTPGELRDQLGYAHDEGPPITQAEYDSVVVRHNEVEPSLRFWMQTVAAEANRAGVPFYLNRHLTTRRFWLYIGLITLAEVGDPESDAVRALVAHATDSDAPLFPSVTVGHAVGAMNAEEAGRFADACSAYAAGEFVAEFTGPGMALRFAPA